MESSKTTKTGGQESGTEPMIRNMKLNSNQQVIYKASSIIKADDTGLTATKEKLILKAGIELPIFPKPCLCLSWELTANPLKT